MKYLYDAEGCKIWAEVLKTSEYYIMKAEEEILSKQSSNILDLMEEEEFVLIDIGAGSGEKTLVFVEQSLRKQKKIEYIGIDINVATNQVLTHNLTKYDESVTSTVITSMFDKGI